MDNKHEEKQRLLIVDDSKVIRVTARKILRDHFATSEAVDGENAWEILTGETPFALVVSDLTMPNLDGFGLLERIRGFHLPQVRELPVIIITGANDTEATRQRAREAGATDFISKPFDAVHLLARAQAHAGSHAAKRRFREEITLLEDQSAVDATTGLANESAFMERGYQLLSYAIRHRSSLALLRIEIDEFGDLYREYGDSLTQAVVQTLAQILAATTRQEDTAARIGPARLALLVPAMDHSGVRKIAERIRHEFSMRTFSTGDKRIQATVSIGVCSPDIRRNTRFEELLSAADRRLAHAIAQGGNRIVRKDADTAPLTETDHAATMAVPAAGNPAAPTLAMLLAGDEALEIEEIELTSPAFSFTQPFAWDAPQETKSPSPAAPEPLIAAFAGTRPEQTPRESAPVTRSAGTPPAAGAPETPVDPPGKAAGAAPGTTPDTRREDAIVISAPFSAHSPGKTERGATAESATRDVNSQPGAGSSPDTGAQEDREPRRRGGFFRKTLGLFGRFGTR